jgi:cytochrome c peroxidase
MGSAPATALLLAAACRAAAPGSGVLLVSRMPLGAVPSLPVPAANPLSCERVDLGRALFFETRLSRGGTVACASCHDPERAFTDGLALPRGDDGAKGRRNAPTLVGRAYGSSQFWDGRAATLEEQVLLPLTDSLELGNTHDAIERLLGGDSTYRRRFAAAFGEDRPTIERVGLALASFVRSVVSGDSPVDQFSAGGDSAALASLAREGFNLFRFKGGCERCHEPPHFTDERFHNTGVAWRDGAYSDSGRFRVTARLEDLGAFKTPTLRNIERTAPYMHDGSLATLEAVVDFYDGGGRVNRNLDPLLKPLNLDDGERAALLAFLRSLSGTISLSGETCTEAPGDHAPRTGLRP